MTKRTPRKLVPFHQYMVEKMSLINRRDGSYRAAVKVANALSYIKVGKPEQVSRVQVTFEAMIARLGGSNSRFFSTRDRSEIYHARDALALQLKSEDQQPPSNGVHEVTSNDEQVAGSA